MSYTGLQMTNLWSK